MTAIYEISTSSLSSQAADIFRRNFRRALGPFEDLDAIAYRETGKLVRSLLDCEEAFGIELDVDDAVAAHDVRGLLRLIEDKARAKRPICMGIDMASGPERGVVLMWPDGARIIAGSGR